MRPIQLISCSHHFLIAMPKMWIRFSPNPSPIAGANTTSQGALGVVVNRPIDSTCALFERITLRRTLQAFRHSRLFRSVRWQTDRGVVLLSPLASGIHLRGRCATSSASPLEDILEAVGKGSGPGKRLVSLGYSGWRPANSSNELVKNAWLTGARPADQLRPAFRGKTARRNGIAWASISASLSEGGGTCITPRPEPCGFRLSAQVYGLLGETSLGLPTPLDLSRPSRTRRACRARGHRRRIEPSLLLWACRFPWTAQHE